MTGIQHPITPDGRYFVVKGRLWRLADPALDAVLNSWLVRELMTARRAVKDAGLHEDILKAILTIGDLLQAVQNSFSRLTQD